jgi:hypothetical protein
MSEKKIDEEQRLWKWQLASFGLAMLAAGFVNKEKL